MTDLTRIEFNGGDMLASSVDGAPMVAIKPICDSLGVAAHGQVERLKRQPWASTRVTRAQLPGDSQHREVVMIDRRTLTMWLATIQTSRLKNDDARTRLAAFQCEAADALDAYFHEGGAVNPNATPEQAERIAHEAMARARIAQARLELCHAAEGLIDPAHLEARARVALAFGMDETAELDDKRRPLYVKTFLEEINVSKKVRDKWTSVFSKKVLAAYVERNGVEPGKYPLTLPNGQVRDARAYTEADRPFLQEMWAEFVEAKGIKAGPENVLRLFNEGTA